MWPTSSTSILSDAGIVNRTNVWRFPSCNNNDLINKISSSLNMERQIPCRNKLHHSTLWGSVMFCDCNAFVQAIGVSGPRWRCSAYILFQSRFPPWFLLSPTNLALGSVHYTVLYSPSIRASLPLDWRSHQNPREKSLTFIGQDGDDKEDPLGAKKQDTVWCESCFLKPTLSFLASLVSQLATFLLCEWPVWLT